MNRQIVKNHLHELSNIQDERNNIYIDWLKNTLTIASALLAILVSLKTEKSANILEHYLFITTVCSIGIGVFAGVLSLYSYVVIHNRTIKLKTLQVLDVLDDRPTNTVERINRPKFYDYIEYICFISLTIGLITFIAYGIISDIKTVC